MNSAPLSYAVWNNKGGVGKTFLSFVLATEFALLHPERNVVVIDMCPQANLSEIMLGGNGIGASRLDELIRRKKTIGGYFSEKIKSPFSEILGSENTYPVKVIEMNPNIPKNIQLVAGDPSLEVQAQSIQQLSRVPIPGGDPWKAVHSWLIYFIRGLTSVIADPLFIIDCNPSFSSYTELALLAANRLILPCTADGSSARAVDNVGHLVYGVGIDAVYKPYNLSTLADHSGMALPSIHSIPLNRSTTYDKKASKAFGLMHDEVERRIALLHGSIGRYFSQPLTKAFGNMPDAHTSAVVACHTGMPITKLVPGKHLVHGQEVQINKKNLDHYQREARSLASSL